MQLRLRLITRVQTCSISMARLSFSKSFTSSSDDLWPHGSSDWKGPPHCWFSIDHGAAPFHHRLLITDEHWERHVIISWDVLGHSSFLQIWTSPSCIGWGPKHSSYPCSCVDCCLAVLCYFHDESGCVWVLFQTVCFIALTLTVDCFAFSLFIVNRTFQVGRGNK